MILQVAGKTGDEVWRKAAGALLDPDGGYSCQNSRLGPVREFLHSSLHLSDPTQRWVLSRKPAMNPAFAIAEVVWLLRGRNDAAFLNFWNPLLPKFSGSARRYHGAYGYRLRHSRRFDQLERAYQVLAKNPESRQVVLQIWDSSTDFPTEDGGTRDPDIPCNVVAMPKVRGGRLEWLQVMRSNDVYLGTPHNLVQFTSLQEVMAGWLGLQLGSFVLVSDSLHVYEHDLEQCSVEVANTTPLNSDSLALPKGESEAVLQVMSGAMDTLRGGRLTTRKFREVICEHGLPLGWANMLYVAAADSARRRGWSDEMELAVSGCDNPALRSAWAAWRERCEANSPSS